MLLGVGPSMCADGAAVASSSSSLSARSGNIALRERGRRTRCPPLHGVESAERRGPVQLRRQPVPRSVADLFSCRSSTVHLHDHVARLRRPSRSVAGSTSWRPPDERAVKRVEVLDNECRALQRKSAHARPRQTPPVDADVRRRRATDTTGRACYVGCRGYQRPLSTPIR